jgi:hypothetical protein
VFTENIFSFVHTLFIDMFYELYKKKTKKKRKQSGEKRWLFEEVINNGTVEWSFAPFNMIYRFNHPSLTMTTE